MNLIDKLKLMHSLSPSEEVLRSFIVHNSKALININKESLIDRLHISSSTIYRFCNKLDVKGYDGLRLILAQEYIKNEKSDNEFVNYNFPFQKKDSLHDVSKNIMLIYGESAALTYKSIDFNELAKAVEILKKANTICLMTSNMNTQFAEKFGIQLKEIGKNVRISSSPYKWKLETMNLTTSDALIINSYAAQSSKSFIGILPSLYKKHIPIILIGSTHNKSFMPYASSKLLMCDKEHPKEKLYSFSTNIATQYLFDILYAALYQENYEDNFSKHEYIYE